MLELSKIRIDPEEIINRLKVRNFEGRKVIDKILLLDGRRKKTQAELDTVLAQLNSISKEIGVLYREEKKEKAEPLKLQTGNLKEEAKKSGDILAELEREIHSLLLEIPNVPHESVPPGLSAAENCIVKEEGALPDLPADSKPHWELAEKYDIIDFGLGSKITGSGFPVYKRKGAKLQRALVNFFLDQAVNKGYWEIQPPVLVNEASGYGTGQLPDKEGQMYHVEIDNLYLVPTAEVPLTNLYRDVILKYAELPVKITGYTPCFRREAGSYGKEVKGLNRLHQFDKVEIVQIRHPDDSYAALEEMLSHVSGLLRQLELPFRIAKLCGGDLGFTSALTYDMEVFCGAQKKWLEVSSVSNFES